MSIEELIRRIRVKEDPQTANQLINRIHNEGESFISVMKRYYDDNHMNYDSVLPSEINHNVNFVQKDKLYGIVNGNGEIIIPCKFNEYYDAYREWRDLGFPTKPISHNDEMFPILKIKDTLNSKHNELIESGDIKQMSFYKDRTVICSEFVKLADGTIGIAASLGVYLNDSGKNLEIKDSNGNHIMYITEPELLNYDDTPFLKICTDQDNLYVASYNTKYAYIACYRMGDFERVWKTPMYGCSFQSITVNDSDVIVFDINNAQIGYFDKFTGIIKKDKEINTASDDGLFTKKSQHNLVSTNETLLAGIPGFSFKSFNIPNELKLFDNETGETLNAKQIDTHGGMIKGITIDSFDNRVFLAIDNKIIVYKGSEYKGFFLAPTGNVHKLTFDQGTGCLLVSMTDGSGKVEVYNPNAIEELLQTSRELGVNNNTFGYLESDNNEQRHL